MELLMNIVSDIGSDEFYRASRYKVPLVVVLINSKDKDIFDTVDENIRQTDIVQQLSSNLIVVFLTHTNLNASLLCMEKINKIVDLTYTLAEFQGSEEEFIEELFSKNEEKLLD